MGCVRDNFLIRVNSAENTIWCAIGVHLITVTNGYIIGKTDLLKTRHTL